MEKLARYFQSMEEESGYLTSDTEPHSVDEILRQETGMPHHKGVKPKRHRLFVVCYR